MPFSGFRSTGAHVISYIHIKNCGTRDLTHMLITEQHENPLQNRDLDNRGLTNPSTRDTRNNIIILFFLCSSNEWSISDKCPSFRSLRDNVRKLFFEPWPYSSRMDKKRRNRRRLVFLTSDFSFQKVNCFIFTTNNVSVYKIYENDCCIFRHRILI